MPTDLWRRFLDAPRSAAVLTDFDGTLAAIGDDPDATVALPGAVEALGACGARFRTCAVVSGRPASFLVGVLGTGIRLSALYGLESVAPGNDGRIDLLAEAAPYAALAESAAAEVEAAAPAGVRVERKGVSITVHVRQAPAAAAWAAAAVADIAARTGLEVHLAKMSYELRPPLRIDKGTVVADLAAGCDAVCYLGDDVGDLPAFAALDAMAAGGVVTVKVAVDTAELDPAVRSGADVLVDGPAAAVAVLQHLGGAAAP